MKKYTLTLVAAATLIASGAIVAKPTTGLTLGVDGGYALSTAVQAQKGVLQNNPFKKTSSNQNHIVIGAHAAYSLPVTDSLSAGVEAGYLHLGSSSVKAVDPVDTPNSYKYTVSQQMITMLATAHYDVMDNIGVFAKAGGAYIFQDNDFKYFDTPAAQDRTLSVDDKLKGFRPMAAAGVDYNVDNILLSLSYNHVFGKKQSSNEVVDNNFVIKNSNKKLYGSNMILAGIGYTF